MSSRTPPLPLAQRKSMHTSDVVQNVDEVTTVLRRHVLEYYIV